MAAPLQRYFPAATSLLSGHTNCICSLFTEENCTYFRHFTPGQDAEIFEYKTQKGA